MSFFARGDIPISATQISSKNTPLSWKISPEKIDYKYFYPIFVDGLREADPNARMVATRGCIELLQYSSAKVRECLPQFILPLRSSA